MEHPRTRKCRDLASRLAAYAAQVLRVAGAFPTTKEGRHVQDQLLRSGTAPGAHYAEARSSQSAADFIHKVGLAAKEARESVHWLQTSHQAQLIAQDVCALVDEGEQLTAILTASLQTAKRNQKKSEGS
jgi:four helix bundle protein